MRHFRKTTHKTSCRPDRNGTNRHMSALTLHSHGGTVYDGLGIGKSAQHCRRGMQSVMGTIYRRTCWYWHLWFSTIALSSLHLHGGAVASYTLTLTWIFCMALSALNANSGGRNHVKHVHVGICDLHFSSTDTTPVQEAQWMSRPPAFLLTCLVHAALRGGVEPCDDDTRVSAPRRIDDVLGQDHRPNRAVRSDPCLWRLQTK